MSDDDFDGRRRDKFRAERSGDRGRGGDRYEDDGPRRDRYGRDGRDGNRGRDYDRHERDSKRRRTPERDNYNTYHRDNKRSRNDYDAGQQGGDGGGGGRGGGRGGYQGNHHFNDHHRGGNSWGGNNRQHFHHNRDMNNFHPNQNQVNNNTANEEDVLLSFKNWVIKQDDNINEDDACKNYKTYKTEFKKKQMQEFFVAHKDEEWFRDKYHPDASDERSEQFKEAVKARWLAWQKLVKMENVFDGSELDITKEQEIIKLLETAVMLMEGATEEDISLIRAAPVNVKEPSVKEQSNNESVEDDRLDENGDAKRRDKFSRHADESEDDTSEKNDGAEKKRKASKDSTESLDGKEEKMSQDGPESGIDDGELNDGEINDGEEGELNDPSDELEAKRQEALKRAQSRYSSIFMRSLPPTISRQDISNMCKKFDGFIRVAFSHPQDERFFRRCWVTFDHSVNIKDICWNLNNIRLKDVELNPVVNRDLTRRCRPMSSLANHNVIMRADLVQIIKIIERFDKKFELYSTGEEKKNELVLKAEQYMTDNPLQDDQKSSDEIQLNYNKNLAKIVDLLTLYLRLVHSVDYYNHSEYRNEDEMPNRCGIIHVRGEPPSNPIMPFEMNDYMKKFAEKANNMLSDGQKLETDDTKALGKKEEEEEVKKFIDVNTQQLAPEKYLCPLSGKKFKGPEFVRKHIMVKHGDKVEAVRKEVNFFNNYLCDPRRPSDPIQSVQPFRPPMGVGFGAPGGDRPPLRHHQVSTATTGPPQPPNATDNRRPGQYVDHDRPVVQYTDLDAPEDVDIF